MTMTRRRGPTCRRSARRGQAAPPSGVIRVRPDAPLLLNRLPPQAVPRAPALRLAVPRPQALPAAVPRARAAQVFPGPQGVQAGTVAPKVAVRVPTVPAAARKVPGALVATAALEVPGIVSKVPQVLVTPEVPGGLAAPGATGVPPARKVSAAPSGPLSTPPAPDVPASASVPVTPSPLPGPPPAPRRRARRPACARTRRCRRGPSGRNPGRTTRMTCRPSGPVSRVSEAPAEPCGPRRAVGGGGW
jgi:hypothetical protein